MPFENDENQSLNNPMSWENNVTDGESRLNVESTAYIAQQNSILENRNSQSSSNTTTEQESGMSSTFDIQSENTQSENSHSESIENSSWRSSVTPSENLSVIIDVNSSTPNTAQANASGCVDNDNQSRLNDTKPFTPFITRREPVSKYSKTPSEQMIIFSDRAYNAIISEAFAKDPVETGGILIGHVLNNGFWIVTEVIPPGKSSINEYAYFEYDTSFVNYVANRVAIQFEIPPRVLGLWHRHPGSMDYFSSTDDGTNKTFASLDRNNGAVSALVNIDPDFRITIYHATLNPHTGVRYEKMPYEVGDELIPAEYFKLKYYPEFGKNPALSSRRGNQTTSIQQPQQSRVTDSDTVNSVTNQATDMENHDPFQVGSASDSDSHSTPMNIYSGILNFIICVLLAYCFISCVMIIHTHYQDRYQQHTLQRETYFEPVPQKYEPASDVGNPSLQSIPEAPIHTTYHTSDRNGVLSETIPTQTLSPSIDVIPASEVPTDNNVESTGNAISPTQQAPQPYGVPLEVKQEETNSI